MLGLRNRGKSPPVLSFKMLLPSIKKRGFFVFFPGTNLDGTAPLPEKDGLDCDQPIWTAKRLNVDGPGAVRSLS